MQSNAQKTPIARTLNRFAEGKAARAIAMTGRSLPASVVSRSGGIVTVKFEVSGPYTLPNVTVPMIGSEYVRVPIQAGCLGWVMSADAYLGGMSGLGGGTADLSLQGNLSSLVWSPIGNKNWSASEDDNAVVIYGPDGVVIRTVNSHAKATVAPSNITLEIGGISIVLTDSEITFTGPVIFDGVASGPGGIVDFGSSTIETTGTINGGSVVGGGKVLETHIHGGVQSGGSDTGPPV